MGLHAITEHVDNLHQQYEGKVIFGHFTVGRLLARVLFDSRADRSFLSTSFLQRSCISIEPLNFHLQIQLPDGSLFMCNRIFPNFALEILGIRLLVYLIVFEWGTYDIILGMDWLNRHRAEILCRE